MNTTLGAPGLARTGAGHAGEDSPMVRPMRPGNVVPGLYSRRSAFAEPDRPVVVSAEAAINELPLNSRSRRFIPLPPCGPVSFDRSSLMTASLIASAFPPRPNVLADAETHFRVTSTPSVVLDGQAHAPSIGVACS